MKATLRGLKRGVLLLLGLTIVSLISLPESGAAAGAAAHRLRLSAPSPVRVTGTLLDTPPIRSADQTAADRQIRARAPLTVPTAVDSGVPIIAPTGASTAPPAKSTTSRATGAVPETFHFFSNRMLPQPGNGTVTSIVNEPTVASGNDVLLYAGNWYAAISDNGGTTFGYLDPYDNFPQDGVIDDLYGGFCCDQVAVYDANTDAYFWALLYADNGFTNAIRVAVADGSAGLLANTWCFWDFIPEFHGFDPDMYFFDFPNLVFSADYLYLTANVFETSTQTFAGSVLLQLPPADMRDCNTFSYSGWIFGDEGSLRCTAGAVDKMHIATHISNTMLRVFTWDEITDDLTSVDVTHAAYNSGPMTAIGPGGANFAGRADDRVLGAWAANGEAGFMWNAAEGGPYPYPHVQVVRLDEATMGLIDQTQIWSSSVAWLYPSAHPNDRGHIGGTIVYGGGAFYPGATAFIADDFNGETFAPLENYGFAWGDSDPAFDGWGDYLCSHHNVPFGNTWVGTGFAMVGGSTSEFVEPSYVWFGRERDCPTLTAPSDVACASVAGMIDISWSHVVGAATYCVYRDGGLLGCTADPFWGDAPVDLDPHCYTVTAQADGCPPSAPSVPVCCQVAPDNDDCASCIFLTGDVVDYPFSTLGATTDGPDEPSCNELGYTQTDSDVWFCWLAGCGGEATVSVCGSGYDTKLAVYDYQSCPPASGPVACNDDYCGVQSQVTFPVVEGQFYQIRIGGHLGAQGAGLLNITLNNVQVVCPGISEPEGEFCGGDINGGCNLLPPAFSPISGGMPVCGTLYAEEDTRDTDWYLFTVTEPSRLIWTARAEIPIQLNILDLTGGCGGATLVYDFGGPCTPLSIAADVPAGEYALFIAPQDYNGFPCAGGPYDYTAWLTCNDQCGNCLPLAGEVQDLPFATYGAATDGPDEPLLCTDFSYSHVESDIWYCWTAECDGDATVSLCGSAYDTKIAIYDGLACPLSASALACNEDACGLQSSVTFGAVAGGEYLIRIGGYFGSQGEGLMNITQGFGCCDCPHAGDANADGNVDALDLQYLIDAVFFGGAITSDPSCPVSRMDVNCDYVPDAVDIQFIIDYIFFGGTPPCDGCVLPTR